MLVLSGSQTLTAMAATQAVLLNALSLASSVVVDCSEISEADTSFVQILVAAQRHARAAGKTLALSQPPSGPLLTTLTRGGFLGAPGRSSLEEQALWQPVEYAA